MAGGRRGGMTGLQVHWSRQSIALVHTFSAILVADLYTPTCPPLEAASRVPQLLLSRLAAE